MSHDASLIFVVSLSASHGASVVSFVSLSTSYGPSLLSLVSLFGICNCEPLPTQKDVEYQLRFSHVIQNPSFVFL
ncbi:hypothetical protein RJT34_12967 [Clitoria ternatea]|uniref:Secreted protein n=1 Tax=Clitoria ternatea TaxID=43366 RepID=A0AAN9PLA1_CLITE